MLIKIANAPYFEEGLKNSYLLFSVKHITRFSPAPITFDNSTVLKEYIESFDGSVILNHERLNELHNIDDRHGGLQPNEMHYQINVIKFIDHDDIQKTVLFDTIAYICNDKGETLEKCFAGGVVKFN